MLGLEIWIDIKDLKREGPSQREIAREACRPRKTSCRLSCNLVAARHSVSTGVRKWRRSGSSCLITPWGKS